MTAKIAIVHALPLEYYPPVTNLLDYLAATGGLDGEVFTVGNTVGRKAYVNPAFPIYRFPLPQSNERTLLRLWKHIGFTIRTVRHLMRLRPDAVLYFEPHSAMPAYVYSHYCKPGVSILVHNHEYYEPGQFEGRGMRVVKTYHKREVEYLYRKAVWVSQTNTDRLELFLRDYPFIDRTVAHVLPNYPPRRWSGGAARAVRKDGDPVRCVHVGAVSLEDTYVREFCEWVGRQNGAVTLDFYDYKIPAGTREFLAGLEGGLIRCFAAGIPYAELPHLLAHYHVGLVLHRGTTANYVFNAPNKLFEYLACGLDVWCPSEMLGVKPYLRRDAVPKVIALDFARLNGFDPVAAVSRDNLRTCSSEYFCENVLSDLKNVLLGHHPSDSEATPR